MSVVRDEVARADSCGGRPALGARRSDELRQPGFGAAFPHDAVACIWRPAPSPLSSRRPHDPPWKLRFERRSPPVADPLMGWIGGGDPLSQVELSFPSRESAIAYAERQGLAYRVESDAHREPKRARRTPRALQSQVEGALASLLWLFWMQARYGGCDLGGAPDEGRAAPERATAFDAPGDVARDAPCAHKAPTLVITSRFGRPGASAR